MSNTTPIRRRLGGRAPLAITVGILVVLLIGFFAFASIYADVLWYQQVGFFNVLTTQWFAVTGFFVAGFIAMAVPVWLSIEIAYRRRPVYARLNSQLDRYQEVIEPLRRLLTFGVPALLGVFSGLSAAFALPQRQCARVLFVLSENWIPLTELERALVGIPDETAGAAAAAFVKDNPATLLRFSSSLTRF